MSKKFLIPLSILAFGLTSSAQTPPTSGSPGSFPYAENPYKEHMARRDKCRADPKSLHFDTVDACLKDEEKEWSREKDNGNTSCASLTKELNQAQKEVAQACSGLGVSLGKNPSPGMVSSKCSSKMNEVSSCSSRLNSGVAKNNGRVMGMDLSILGDPGDKCYWMRGKNKSNLKDLRSEYNSSFKENDQNRRSAEEKYFDTEKDLLSNVNELQSKIEQAQSDAQEAQMRLQEELDKVKGEAEDKAQQAIQQLQALQEQEAQLTEAGNTFIQSEYETTKKQLEFRCSEQAQARINLDKADKGRAKAGNQWKFGSLGELTNLGVNRKRYLKELGDRAYAECMTRDKDFVVGMQVAADALRAKTAAREFELRKIRLQITAISQSLQTLEGNKQNAMQRAIAHADADWRRAQNHVMLLNQQYQQAMAQAAQQQQRNAQEVQLYRGLAAADKQKLDMVNQKLEATGDYDEKDYEVTTDNGKKLAGGLADLDAVIGTIVGSGCCNSSTLFKNVCPPDTSATPAPSSTAPAASK